MYWKVRAVNAGSRLVSLSGPGNPEGVIVPWYIPLPDVGSEVVLDQKTGVVSAVVNLKSMAYSESAFSDMPQEQPGSFSVRMPGRGFISLLKGLKAMFGTGLSNYIYFDGIKNSVGVRSNLFSLNAPKLSISVSAPDDPMAQPEINLAMGDRVSAVLSPGSALFRINLLGILVATVSDEKVLVTVQNPRTGRVVKLVDENFGEEGASSEKDKDKLYDLAAGLIARLNDVTVSSGRFELGASDMELTSATGLLLSGQELVLSAGKKINLTAQNVKIDLGENLKPGGFQINNGTAAHFRMKNSGMITMYGKLLQIGGVDEVVANGYNTHLILSMLLGYMTTMNTALGAVPQTAAASAAGSTILSNVQMMLKDIPNKNIQIGHKAWNKAAVN